MPSNVRQQRNRDKGKDRGKDGNGNDRKIKRPVFRAAHQSPQRRQGRNRHDPCLLALWAL
jgi:hypothetical protein